MTTRTELIQQMVELATKPGNEGKSIAYAAADYNTLLTGFKETASMLVHEGHNYVVSLRGTQIQVINGATIRFFSSGRLEMIYGGRNIGVFVDDSRDHFYDMLLALLSTQKEPGPFRHASSDK